MLKTPNGRLALTLFGVYLLLYAGFLLINVFSPSLMEWRLLADVNLAIWYGFGLIAAAIILAFLYGVLCIPADLTTDKVDESERNGEEQA